MAERENRPDQDSMRHPEQKQSSLASTREDASLADQVLGDSSHPDARKWLRSRSTSEEPRRS